MRAALLEVVNDTLGSLAVLISAVVIALTGWERADAVASLVIAALIVPRTLKLLRETVLLLLESTPPGMDLDDVRAHLLALPHVLEVHDLHASQITSGLPVLSAHVVVEDSCFHDGHAAQLLDLLQSCVAEHFPVSVEHSTFQLEMARHAEHELAAHSCPRCPRYVGDDPPLWGHDRESSTVMIDSARDGARRTVRPFWGNVL